MKILTFDIEDWFHLLDLDENRSHESWNKRISRVVESTRTILDLLQSHNQKATFFVLGWVAEQYPQLIREIDARGFEIGSHSMHHQLAYEQSQQDFQTDTENSISVIEDAVGKKIKYYRAPGFSITSNNAWAFDVLNELGITIDCSIFPAGRAHGGFKNFGSARPAIICRNNYQLKELPINTATFLTRPFIFSGGGYFRLLPYPLINRLSTKSDYLMTYFHPRDFDVGQPVMTGLSRSRRFKSYVGIEGALTKIDRLLTDFKFLDVTEANTQIDWHAVEKIQL